MAMMARGGGGVTMSEQCARQFKNVYYYSDLQYVDDDGGAVQTSARTRARTIHARSHANRSLLRARSGAATRRKAFDQTRAGSSSTQGGELNACARAHTQSAGVGAKL